MEAPDTSLEDAGIHIAGAIISVPRGRYRVIRNKGGEWCAIVYFKTVDKERKRSPWKASRTAVERWVRQNLPRPRKRKAS